MKEWREVKWVEGAGAGRVMKGAVRERGLRIKVGKCTYNHRNRRKEMKGRIEEEKSSSFFPHLFLKGRTTHSV